jgi:hypothetical protein
MLKIASYEREMINATKTETSIQTLSALYPLLMTRFIYELYRPQHGFVWFLSPLFQLLDVVAQTPELRGWRYRDDLRLKTASRSHVVTFPKSLSGSIGNEGLS